MDRYNTDSKYRKMVDDALTKGPSQKSLAMQKDLRKNPNLTVNELVKRQTVDTSSLNQLIKKTEENIAFDKKYPPLVSTKAMLDNDLIDADKMLVQYDSATGLFTNKEKSVAFKDAVSARKHNQVYEPYSPTVQKLKRAATPYPTQANPQQMDYLKKNLDKMKYQNKPTYKKGEAKIVVDELKRQKRKANPILNVDPIVKPISIPDAVEPEPVKPITREELLRNIEEHSKRTPTANDMTGIFSTNEYYLRKKGI